MRAVSSKFDSINKKAVKAVFFGAVVGTLITIIITILASLLIIAIGKLPEGLLEYISLGILALGGFIGGYIAGRIYKKNGIFIGLATGLFMYIIVFIAGISSISGGFTIFSLLKLIVLLFFSIVSAILAVNKKEKIRYK